MTWRVHRWTWRIESPLFVGTAPAGALNRCRLYVPGRTLWGALTAELARQEDRGVEFTAERYKSVGDDLQRDYRLSYLFPAEEVSGRWQAWLPRYESGLGLAWRREDDHAGSALVSDREFRRRLLYTRAGTAIDPQSDSAAEGSLRETECIQPCWRDEDGQDAGPVGFVGYVLVRESGNASSSGIQRLDQVGMLFVGGDTRYGLGRLELIAVEPVQGDNPIFGVRVDLGGKSPVVESTIALAHTSGGRRMSGSLEVLSGWEVGKPIDVDAIPFWTPGSRTPDGDAVRLRVEASGIWRFEEENDAEGSTTGATSA